MFFFSLSRVLIKDQMSKTVCFVIVNVCVCARVHVCTCGYFAFATRLGAIQGQGFILNFLTPYIIASVIP